MATASSFVSCKDQKQSKKRIKGLNFKRKEPKAVDCKDKLAKDKFEALKLHTEDQSLEGSAAWRVGSQELVDPFAELYPELSQALTVDESELDSEREESSEDHISPSSGEEDIQCVPVNTKEIIKSNPKRKRAKKKRTKSKMEQTALEDSQLSFSSDTQSQKSDSVKAKRKSRTPRKVMRKKVKQIKQEPDSDEEHFEPEKEKLGSWAQCSVPLCSKWRYLKTKVDPTEIPDRWVCSMNPDPEFNTCEAAQELFDSQDENYDVVYSPYPSGAIVWAKLAGYPWWPAMMQDDPDYSCYYESRPGSRTPVSYHVVFFDKDVSRAWVGCANVRTFHLADKPDDMASGKGRKLKHSRQLQQATEDARKAFEMPLEERLDIYGFAKRYNGPIGYQQVAEAAKSGESEGNENQEEHTLSSQESAITNESGSSSEDTKKTEKLTNTKKTPRKTPSKSAVKHKVPAEADKTRKEINKKAKKKKKPAMKTGTGEKAAAKKGDKPTKPVFKCKKAKLESTKTDSKTTVQECEVLSEVVEEMQNTATSNRSGENVVENCEFMPTKTAMDGSMHTTSIGTDTAQVETQVVQPYASENVKSQAQLNEATQVKSDTAHNSKSKKPRKRKRPSVEAKVEKTTKKSTSAEASKKKTKKLSKEASETRSSENCERENPASTETVLKTSSQDGKSRKPKQIKGKNKMDGLKRAYMDEGGDKTGKAEQLEETARDFQGTEIPQTSENPWEHAEATVVEETLHSTCSSQQKNGKKKSAGKKTEQCVVGATKGNVSLTDASTKAKIQLSEASDNSSHGKRLEVKAMPKLVKPTFAPPPNAKAQKRIPKLVKARFVSPAQKKPSHQNKDGKSGKENSPAIKNAHKKTSLEMAGQKVWQEEKRAKAEEIEVSSKTRVGNRRESNANKKAAEELHRDCGKEHPLLEEDRNERSFSSVEAEVEELDKEMEELKKDLQHSESTDVAQNDEGVPLSPSRNLSPMQDYYRIKITDSPEF